MNKSEFFPIMVDEARSTILMALIANTIYDQTFIDTMKKEFDIKESDFLEMAKELMIKIHDRGWCKACDCPHNQ